MTYTHARIGIGCNQCDVNSTSRAELRIFAETKSIFEDAKWRHKERGVECDREQVLGAMAERDARDRRRAVAPLAPAKDAFILDTTGLDADAAFAAALGHLRRKDARFAALEARAAPPRAPEGEA